MKLLKCYVQNFGTLNNFSYEFKDGINVINELNGWGKTTFATFIKTMFYGLELSTKAKLEKNEAKKYMPWNGGNFGGNIDFEINNKKYRIERFFNNKKEEFKLYDLGTNLQSNDYSKNIGEEIFKVDKEAFERSIYIPQQQIKVIANDSLSAKLTNLLENKNDIENYEVALEKLDSSIKIYEKTGERGKIPEIENKINNLKRSLENCIMNEDILNSIKEEINKKEIQIKQNSERLDVIDEKIQMITKNEIIIAKNNHYKKLQDSLEEKINQIKKLKEFFKNNMPEEEKIEEISNLIPRTLEYEKQIEEYNNINKEYKNYEKIFGDQVNFAEHLTNNINKYKRCEELKNNILQKQESLNNKRFQTEEILKQTNIVTKKQRTQKIMLIINIIIIILAIALVFFNKIIGFTTIAIDLLVFIVLFIWKSKDKKVILNKESNNDSIDNLKEEIENLISEEKRIQVELTEFISKYNYEANDMIFALTNINEKYNNYYRLKEKLRTFTQRQDKLNQIKLEVIDFFNKYYDDINEDYGEYILLLTDVKNKKNELLRLIKEVEKETVEKETFEKENNFNEIENIEYEENIEELQVQKEELKNEQKIFIKELENLKTRCFKNSDIVDEKPEIESEIENLSILLEEIKNKVNILKKSKEYLEKARNQFSEKYLDSLSKGFKKYATMLKAKELDNCTIDINLDVQIEGLGSKKSSEYLSAGYKDLIGICTRFALVDAIFTNQPAFLVLDDPFVNLDEEKLEKAMELLKQVSNQYQIIYFVCHPSRQIGDSP